MSNIEKLFSKRKDYCIVGNSPCEIGQRHGHKIDSHDLIIRFNDFSLNKKFRRDYGRKTNVWIRGTNDHLVYTFEQKKKILDSLDMVVIRAKKDRNEKSRKYFREQNINFDCFPIKYELELTKILGHCPSTGLLTLFILKSIHGKLDPSRIYGFSFCRENRRKDLGGNQVHYYNENNLVNPRTGQVEKIKNTFLISKHDWRMEEIFFKKELLR